MSTSLLFCKVQFKYANNLGFADLSDALVCVSVDWQAHSSLGKTKPPSVAVYNLIICFTSNIYQCLIHSKFFLFRYIPFLTQKRSSKNKTILCVPLRNTVGLRPPYIASSPVRNLNNINCLIVGRRVLLSFVQKSLCFKNKKRNAFNSPSNFLIYSFPFILVCDGEDSLSSVGIFRFFKLVPNSCLIQYLDNIKLSSREREEYVGHKNFQVFTVVANLVSKKS